MQKRHIITIAALAITLTATAQSRRMAIFDMPASPTSLSLGGAQLGAEGNIYADPSLLITDEHKTNVDYSFGLVDADAGNMGIHSLTASTRQGKNLLLLGARYYAQGKLDRELDIDMKPIGDGRHLYSYQADAGYGRIMGNVTVYGSLGIASEKTTDQTTAYRVNIGATYHGTIGKGTWQAGAAVRDLGFAVADNKSHALAPLAHAGGSITIPTFTNQKLTAVVDGGAYLPLDDNDKEGTFGGGLAYSFADKLSLRAGAHTGSHDGYVGAGLGVRLGIVKVNAAAKFALGDGNSNIYMIGAGIGI